MNKRVTKNLRAFYADRRAIVNICANGVVGIVVTKVMIEAGRNKARELHKGEPMFCGFDQLNTLMRAKLPSSITMAESVSLVSQEQCKSRILRARSDVHIDCEYIDLKYGRAVMDKHLETPELS